MAQYCNSDNLETSWFHWLLSSRTPNLERYRQLGLLWTKIIGISKDKEGIVIRRNGNTLSDPSHPVRLHCIALPNPIYFETTNGIPNIDLTMEIIDLETDLFSTGSILNGLNQQCVTIPSLIDDGYIKEIPIQESWHSMLGDVNKICAGIATKFKPRSEEEHQELVNSAAVEVIYKLATYRLKYTPGLAPVFNLFTTTIHRILYSIMNRRKTHREGIGKVLAEAESGMLRSSNRSLRVQTHQLRIKSR